MEHDLAGLTASPGIKFTEPQVINEMLRLGNVVSFLPKTVTKDVQFKGYTIPQGYTVQVHLAAVHLDPSLYEDPESFNPWRWMSSSNTNINNGFMSFGGGLRLCPGAAARPFVTHHNDLNLCSTDTGTTRLEYADM